MNWNYIWNFLKTSKTRPWKSGSEALTSLNLFSRSIWLFFRLYLEILHFLSLGIFFVSPLTAWKSNFFKLSGFAGPSGRPNPFTPTIICILSWNVILFITIWDDFFLNFWLTSANFRLTLASKKRLFQLSAMYLIVISLRLSWVCSQDKMVPFTVWSLNPRFTIVWFQVCVATKIWTGIWAFILNLDMFDSYKPNYSGHKTFESEKKMIYGSQVWLSGWFSRLD